MVQRLGLLLLWLVCYAECRTCGIKDVFPNLDELGQIGDWAEEDCHIPEECDTLSLQSIFLGDDGLKKLIKTLTLQPYLTNLERLYLVNNGIEAGGAAALSEALAQHQLPITSLHLWQQSLGDEGAASLTDLILTNSKIQDYALGNNGIGDKGGRALAAALNLNTHVKVGINTVISTRPIFALLYHVLFK